MKAMIAGFGAMLLIAVVASYGLETLGYSSEARASGDAVRLDVSAE